MPNELTIAARPSETSPAPRRDDASQRDVDRNNRGLQGLRVLHVIDRLAIGGTQNLLVRALRELERRGVESHVCVLTSQQQTDDSYREQLEPIYLDFAGEYRNPWGLLRCGGRLRRVMARLQPDILHSYLWMSDVVTAGANRGGATVHVSHIVDRRDWQASDRIVHRFRRWMSQRALRQSGTRFIAVSQAAKNFACEHMEYAPANVAVAANGIDWEQFADRNRRDHRGGRLILGTASRLAEEKGHRFLIEAVARLVGCGCDIGLMVTGEGPMRSALESLVVERNLQRHVEFVGWVPSVREFYQSIDVFVVPSINAEGLPTTILEAMASGCVVVASDVGGAAEAIRDGTDGCLVTPRSVDSLVASIAKLNGDPQSLPRMAESARLRIQAEFTTERMVDVICQAYLEAMEAGPTS